MSVRRLYALCQFVAILVPDLPALQLSQNSSQVSIRWPRYVKSVSSDLDMNRAGNRPVHVTLATILTRVRESLATAGRVLTVVYSIHKS